MALQSNLRAGGATPPPPPEDDSPARGIRSTTPCSQKKGKAGGCYRFNPYSYEIIWCLHGKFTTKVNHTQRTKYVSVVNSKLSGEKSKARDELTELGKRILEFSNSWGNADAIKFLTDRSANGTVPDEYIADSAHLYVPNAANALAKSPLRSSKDTRVTNSNDARSSTNPKNQPPPPPSKDDISKSNDSINAARDQVNSLRNNDTAGNAVNGNMRANPNPLRSTGTAGSSVSGLSGLNPRSGTNHPLGKFGALNDAARLKEEAERRARWNAIHGGPGSSSLNSSSTSHRTNVNNIASTADDKKREMSSTASTAATKRPAGTAGTSDRAAGAGTPSGNPVKIAKTSPTSISNDINIPAKMGPLKSRDKLLVDSPPATTTTTILELPLSTQQPPQSQNSHASSTLFGSSLPGTHQSVTQPNGSQVTDLNLLTVSPKNVASSDDDRTPLEMRGRDRSRDRSSRRQRMENRKAQQDANDALRSRAAEAERQAAASTALAERQLSRMRADSADRRIENERLKSEVQRLTQLSQMQEDSVKDLLSTNRIIKLEQTAAVQRNEVMQSNINTLQSELDNAEMTIQDTINSKQEFDTTSCAGSNFGNPIGANSTVNAPHSSDYVTEVKRYEQEKFMSNTVGQRSQPRVQVSENNASDTVAAKLASVEARSRAKELAAAEARCFKNANVKPGDPAATFGDHIPRANSDQKLGKQFANLRGNTETTSHRAGTGVNFYDAEESVEDDAPMEASTEEDYFPLRGAQNHCEATLHRNTQINAGFAREDTVSSTAPTAASDIELRYGAASVAMTINYEEMPTFQEVPDISVNEARHLASLYNDGLGILKMKGEITNFVVTWRDKVVAAISKRTKSEVSKINICGFRFVRFAPIFNEMLERYAVQGALDVKTLHSCPGKGAAFMSWSTSYERLTESDLPVVSPSAPGLNKEVLKILESIQGNYNAATRLTAREAAVTKELPFEKLVRKIVAQSWVINKNSKEVRDTVSDESKLLALDIGEIMLLTFKATANAYITCRPQSGEVAKSLFKESGRLSDFLRSDEDQRLQDEKFTRDPYAVMAETAKFLVKELKEDLPSLNAADPVDFFRACLTKVLEQASKKPTTQHLGAQPQGGKNNVQNANLNVVPGAVNVNNNLQLAPGTKFKDEKGVWYEINEKGKKQTLPKNRRPDDSASAASATGAGANKNVKGKGKGKGEKKKPLEGTALESATKDSQACETVICQVVPDEAVRKQFIWCPRKHKGLGCVEPCPISCGHSTRDYDRSDRFFKPIGGDPERVKLNLEKWITTNGKPGAWL